MTISVCSKCPVCGSLLIYATSEDGAYRVVTVSCNVCGYFEAISGLELFDIFYDCNTEDEAP